jgi:hypothetical protein
MSHQRTSFAFVALPAGIAAGVAMACVRGGLDLIPSWSRTAGNCGTEDRINP